MARMGTYVVPLVLLAGLVTACGSDDPESPTAAGLDVIRYDTDTPGTGDAALLTGMVQDSGGCLTVQDPTTAVDVTPIFPSSMTSPTPDTLVAGDEVKLRGGTTDAPPEGAVIPEACSNLGNFWLVVDGP